ncbi:hypothetical protein JGU66_13675 [Myxococcaceae bacterium JPH2]|nr:hypothetical protein [Myxococcaceae bacterium JPH2]
MKRIAVPPLLWRSLVLFTATLGACTPAGAPTAVPSHAAHGAEPFDVQAVIRRIHFAFRPEGPRAFSASHDSHIVRAELDGTFHFTPWQPAADASRATEGATLTLRTAAVSRGGPLTTPVVSMREDGALALNRGSVVEVLRNGEDGVEQRWELAAKPSGTEDLEVRVATTGLAYAGRTMRGHHFVDARTGMGVRYGDATWVDARGSRTAVASTYENGALVLRVPARVVEGSAFPAVLAPLISAEAEIDVTPYRPAPNHQWEPTVSYGDGQYLVAWWDLRSGGYDAIYGARVRASDGVVLDKQGITISTNLGAKGGLTSAFDGTNFLVVWQDARNGSNYDIYGARVRASDGVVLNPTGIAISKAAREQTSPSVAFDGTHYLVVWQDTRYTLSTNSDIFGARVRASDGVVLDTAGLPISQRANDQKDPAVSFGGGSFLVIWRDNRNGGDDLFGTRVRPSDGATLDTANGFTITTAAGNQVQPKVTFDGTNHLVVWADARNGNLDIYATRVRASDRSVLDVNGIAVSTAVGGQMNPQVTFASGECFVVWRDGRAGAGVDLYGARVRASDGVVLDPAGLVLVTGAKNEESPAIATDGTQALLAWSEARTELGSDLYATRVRLSDGVPLDGTGLLVATAAVNQTSMTLTAGGKATSWSGQRPGRARARTSTRRASVARMARYWTHPAFSSPPAPRTRRRRPSHSMARTSSLRGRTSATGRRRTCTGPGCGLRMDWFWTLRACPLPPQPRTKTRWR